MKLTIIRGLPGSGKSTLAKKLGCFHVEADMYHMKNGEYSYDGSNAKIAHDWCKAAACTAINNGMDVVVSNTFTMVWEFQHYIDFAKQMGYEVSVIVATGNYGNIHNVPESVLVSMAARWENFDGETFA